MRVEDLNFETHPAVTGGTRASIMFDNGFGASVVTGSMFYTSENAPYEIAVLGENSRITYDTPLTSDVLGYLTEEEANKALSDIEALKAI